MSKKLIKNSIICPDGFILISSHVHDFKSHTYKDGRNYFINGGNEYSRAGFNDLDFKDNCVYEDTPFLEAREKLLWGTYGKSGKEKFKHIAISKMETEHITKVLETQMPNKFYKNIFKKEIKYR